MKTIKRMKMRKLLKKKKLDIENMSSLVILQIFETMKNKKYDENNIKVVNYSIYELTARISFTKLSKITKFGSFSV